MRVAEHATEADTSAYRIVPTGAGCLFSSTNPAQGLLVDYASTGFTLFPQADRSGPHVSFRLTGLGRNGAPQPLDPLSGQRSDGGTLDVELGAVRLHYRNDAQGMRHDVVVQKKPSGAGRLEARFRLEGDLQALQARPDEVVFHRFDAKVTALVPVIRYSGLKAWDAQGSILPATMELQDEDLVLAVMDEGAEYPITIDPLSSTPDREILGTQAGEKLGYSVATAGDVNGDGYSDLLVGSPCWNTPAANAGRVQLFLGSASGIPATAAWSYQGTNANDSLGFSVSSAGDLNGDGFSDVAIGVPGRTSGAGAVFVFKGSVGGLGATPDFTLTGTSGSAFGRSVTLAGDVNGDGYSDVLVGAPRFNSAQGKAFCYLGAALALTSQSGWGPTGSTTNVQLGFSVAGAGDLNGDGYSDVVIGEPYRANGAATGAGAFRIFKGTSTGLSTSASTTQQPSGSSNANVGYSVSSAGDMNGDGYADIVVGAPGAGAGNGAVYVYAGSTALALINTTPVNFTGSGTERLGQAVGLAGDVNGDGYSDIVVGSPNYSTNKGRVNVFRGDATIALDAAHTLITINGLATTARLGAAVCTAGDVNGDGINDLLLAAPDQGGTGAAKVFHGSPDLLTVSAPQWSLLGAVPTAQLGYSVASAGDVNGDGYSDVLVGISGGGGGLKGEVRLFLGSATGLSASPSWTKQGENVNDYFGYAVASAGDVNGDGYSDVLVGAPAWPNGVSGQWRGKAYLFLGSAGGLSGTAAWSNTGPAIESRYGTSVSSAGDVNGDGYSDVIIGASSVPNVVGTGNGAAYVYHGSGTGLPAVADWTMISQQHYTSSSSTFGQCVSLAGDVNGDGYDDVIIGDSYFEQPSGGNLNIGGAFVFHGSPTGLSAAPDWAAYGAGHEYQFGVSVSYAGDVNGDGYSDVIVGAYQELVSSSAQGRAYIYHGSPAGLSATPASNIYGTSLTSGATAGYSVCSAGDVNGDGYSDVVVGASNHDNYDPFASPSIRTGVGAASIHLGGPAGIPSGGQSAAPAMLIGSTINGHFGNSVALAGDVNGDGYSDVIVGASREGSNTEGAAYLWQGNMGRSLTARTFQYRGDLSTPVRTSNGTFQSDCQWGIGQWARSSMGRSKVKLVWQMAGHGLPIPTFPFTNNGTAFDAEDAFWTDSGLSGVLRQRALSTPPATSHPAWRARVRYHRSTALDGRVFGRWYRQGMHDLQVPSIKVDLSTCGPLPVELLGFGVECTPQGARLHWSTASERACARFMVERSLDGKAWSALDAVPCAGNSQSRLDYTYLDTRPPATTGVVYYRLQQYDEDGSVNTLPTAAMGNCAQATGGILLYPNPTDGDALLRLDGLTARAVAVDVFDAPGRLVFSRAIEG
ncbi:MAG: FG-GAP-like repeat-containing protein [Flavobacteriales bacterium]